MSGQIYFSGEEEHCIEGVLSKAVENPEVFVLELEGKLIRGRNTTFFEKKNSAMASFSQRIRRRGYWLGQPVDMGALHKKLVASGRLKVRGIKI